ncbi:lysophospholipid acyltransferase family protein [Enterovirga rhinocerotis]|uniref:1-acyl-sn-glycerol-3-phosphate acyltransferase n=1 Tax=Enterovirga rhinocerotis TaxID=1339210 RepID=A0A4R7BTJ1_9HYPH|nr:lysophospholipid acyltransferase family protein [Enterovirga rhinocerotis]TDR89068.1 1-acyl-sn-glycerol-3-phosphate acyltransferase [Enterovirga rhinocerotis]
MVALRSHLFNLLFYLNLVLWLIPAIATFAMPRKAIIRYAQTWGRFNLWLLRVIVGTRVEFRNLDRIPPGGLLVAAKHQSFLETFTLLFCVDDPTFILKRELQWIPVFGWLTIKAGMIPVRRGGATALGEMNRAARTKAQEGRQVIIFPEGTRRPPGAEPAYKNGVAHLYRTLGMPCLPVGLNSGLFWPRRHYVRRPGTVVIDFCEVIPAGLDRETFMTLLIERIETSSDALLAEAGGAPAPTASGMAVTP